MMQRGRAVSGIPRVDGQPMRPSAREGNRLSCPPINVSHVREEVRKRNIRADFVEHQ